MTMVSNPTDRRVVLDGISWATYQSLLAEVGDRHTRLTFDGGRLEIMSPLPIHEHIKKNIARLVEAYADEIHLPVEGLGSTTFQREDLEKGLEPGECYYIQNEFLQVSLKKGQSAAVTEFRIRLRQNQQ